MADKEINIKITASTDDAKKGIAEVANELDKMNSSSSGKAADELDKVTESAEEAGAATDKLVSSWNEYKQKVREAEAEVRKLNATQFETTEQRDAAINSLGDKLDQLVYDGKAIEDSMKSLGVSPDTLQGFEAIVSVLERANKEFEISLNNKEKLLNQPSAPNSPFVTTAPWDGGPGGNGPNDFKRRYEEMRAELEAYASQLGSAIAANDRMKAALESELASLDQTAAGYLEQKKLLEGLISACSSYAVSSETQRQSIQKQKEALSELNAEMQKTENWDEGLQMLDKYGNTLVATSLKVQKSTEQQGAIQSKYKQAVAAAQETELKGIQKLQSQMEVAGKTRAELIQLFERYKKAVSEANTAEEMAAAQAGLSATRKQLALVTREAALTGETMIGTQTSVQGLLTTISRRGVQGRLTFAALTRGVKLFAKSTVVLAAVQLVWEGIFWAIDKAKEALFGTAEAEEEAAEKAKALADAAKKASENLLDAQHALAAWRLDEVRKSDAEAFKRTIEEQNEAYKRQVEIIEKIKTERIYNELQEATGKEREIALQKLELQSQRTAGLISEKKYQEEILALEYKSAQIKRNAEVFKKREEADAAKKKLDTAQVAFNDFPRKSPVSMKGFEMSPATLKTAIEEYNLLRAEVDKNNNEFGALLSKKTELEKRISAAEALGLTSETKYRENKDELFNISEQLKRFETAEKQAEEAYEKIPVFVRKLGLTGESVSEYSKQRSSLKKQQDEQEKELERLNKEVERLEKEEAKARQAADRAAKEAKEADAFEAKVKKAKLKNLKEKEKQDKLNQQNEKKVDALEKEVSDLTLEELRLRRSQLKSSIKNAKSSTEKSRLKKQIEVYNKAISGRKESLNESAEGFAAGAIITDAKYRARQGQAAEKYISSKLASADAAEQGVINNLAKLASNAITKGKVTGKLLGSVEKLAQQAAQTTGNDDNLALERVITLLQQLITTTESNKGRIKKFNARLNTLSRRAINQDS